MISPEELHATANRSAKLLLMAMVIAVLVLSGISFFIDNTIVHPIRNIMELAVQTGNGDFFLPCPPCARAARRWKREFPWYSGRGRGWEPFWTQWRVP